MSFDILRSHRGTTLLEMLVVAAIIGLLTTISLPRIDYAHFRVDAAIRSVGTT
jgi:prepilin-type N-terminal cleavage/methylation domain-containing protein